MLKFLAVLNLRPQPSFVNFVSADNGKKFLEHRVNLTFRGKA
jgi:hypothetical protein